MADEIYELNHDGDEQPPKRSGPTPEADVQRGGGGGTYDLENDDELQIEQIDAPAEPPRKSRKKKPKPAADIYDLDPFAEQSDVTASSAAASETDAEPATRRLIFSDEEKYCIHCGGKMRDLTEPECPHCHAPFAVNDPKSYSDEPVVGRRDQTEPIGPRLAWIAGVFVVGWIIGFFVLYGIPIFGPTLIFPIWIPVLVYLAMPLFPDYWTDSLMGQIAIGAVVGGIAGMSVGTAFPFLFGILMGAFTGLVRRNMTM